MAKLLLDAGYTKEKVDSMGKGIMNISFLSDQEIQQLLSEAGFQNITRFFLIRSLRRMDEPRLTQSPHHSHNQWWGLKLRFIVVLSGLSTNTHHIEKITNKYCNNKQFHQSSCPFFIELLCLDIISGSF